MLCQVLLQKEVNLLQNAAVIVISDPVLREFDQWKLHTRIIFIEQFFLYQEFFDC